MRRRTGLSLADLAALLGITRQYLHMLETGSRVMGPTLAARLYALIGTKAVSGFDGDD
jgi:transcriptional regulator with XRE-family HTH domain